MIETQTAKPAFRVKGLPGHWEQFALCVLFHLLFPLLPVGVEYSTAGVVSGGTVTMATAIYAITVGNSSKSRLLFGTCVILCVLFSLSFGLLVGSTNATAAANARFYSGCALALVFLVHGLERYNRHVVDRTPYWEF